MCTNVVFRSATEPGLLLFAGNRDDRFGRPIDPPSHRGWYRKPPPGMHPLDWEAVPLTDPLNPVLCPSDDNGGTWVGMTLHLFCAMTPARSSETSPTRSRSLLVRDLLGESGGDSAARRLERAVRKHRYLGFNLVVADGSSVHLWS